MIVVIRYEWDSYEGASAPGKVVLTVDSPGALPNIIEDSDEVFYAYDTATGMVYERGLRVINRRESPFGMYGELIDGWFRGAGSEPVAIFARSPYGEQAAEFPEGFTVWVGDDGEARLVTEEEYGVLRTRRFEAYRRNPYAVTGTLVGFDPDLGSPRIVNNIKGV